MSPSVIEAANRISNLADDSGVNLLQVGLFEAKPSGQQASVFVWLVRRYIMEGRSYWLLGVESSDLAV